MTAAAPDAVTIWKPGAELGPGVWRDVPAALYHAGPGISKSGLDLIAESPALYRQAREHPRPDTASTFLGTVLHALVLEPDTFASRYVALPADAPKRPTARQVNAKKPSPETLAAIAWWAEFDAANAGRVVVPNADGETIYERDTWSTVHYMRDAVMAHPEAAIFLDQSVGLAELSAYWVDPTMRRLCRSRFDFFNFDHRLIVDLKSTRDASLSGFQRSVHDWRYDVQAAFYLDGGRLQDAIPTPHAFVFVAVESAPPYHVGCYELDAEWVRQGREKYRRNLRTFDDCMASGAWPGLPDETRVLPMPGYAKFNPVS